MSTADKMTHYWTSFGKNCLTLKGLQFYVLYFMRYNRQFPCGKDDNYQFLFITFIVLYFKPMFRCLSFIIYSSIDNYIFNSFINVVQYIIIFKR